MKFEGVLRKYLHLEYWTRSSHKSIIFFKKAEHKANWIDRPVGGQVFLADSSQYPK